MTSGLQRAAITVTSGCDDERKVHEPQADVCAAVRMTSLLLSTIRLLRLSARQETAAAETKLVFVMVLGTFTARSKAWLLQVARNTTCRLPKLTASTVLKDFVKKGDCSLVNRSMKPANLLLLQIFASHHLSYFSSDNFIACCHNAPLRPLTNLEHIRHKSSLLTYSGPHSIHSDVPTFFVSPPPPTQKQAKLHLRKFHNSNLHLVI